MAGGGASEDGDIGFQIAPMVDVVFVLLLFFMASAGSQIVEHELNISLPSGRGAADPNAVPNTPIIISIDGKGAVSANEQNFDNPGDKTLPGLRTYLKGIMDRYGGKDPVIIRPTPDARQDRIIDVLNAAAASGVTKLTFG
ncbi:MAG: biopolymer transporter ExbD [Chthoniobacterales bacterium]